jgi:tetratricopeptide (TPR) repeat protein
MPSHIFMRTGRYADAADANERAIAADKAYFALAPAPNFYSLYYVHNVHFLCYAAMMECRYETAIGAARQLEREIPEPFLQEWTFIADGFMPTALHVMIRFGRWQDVLAEPEPPEYRKLSRAVWHYARGVALANLDRSEQARAELAAFDAAVLEVPADWVVGNNPANTVLPLARNMMEGEILFKEADAEAAFVKLRAAVALEDELVYDEPPGWMQPVRHALGALLLDDGREVCVVEAEAVYRADLERHPNNGWSLLGLRNALDAQGEGEEASAVGAQLAKAWKRADVKPTSSCYCAPAS